MTQVIYLKVEVKHSAQRLPAKNYGGSQAGDVLVVRAVNVGPDGVLAL